MVFALAKDPNFAVAPNKIPKKEIINQIESSIYRLPLGQTDNIRTQLLSFAKPSHHQTLREKRESLSKI